MEMSKWIAGIAVIIILAAGALSLTRLSPTGMAADGESISLGVLVPLTGDASGYGEAWRNGAELAAEEFERKHNTAIGVISEDTAFEPSKAVTAAQKLINIDKVDAIIVGSSRETLAVAPLAEENRVLLMSAGSAAKITDAGDYVFRIYPSDLYQGNDLAELAISQGFEGVGVLYMLDEYGKGLSSTFGKRFEELGGRVVAAEGFPDTGARDFRTQLAKIYNPKPDAILVLGTEAHHMIILKQIGELGMDIPILASETMQSQAILDEVGDLAEGVLFTAYTEPETGENLNFISLYRERYGKDPGAFSASFYDNTLLVLEALEENQGDTDRARDWLYGVRDWPGATGLTTFNENGDPVGKSYTVYIVRNGEFVPYGG